MNNSRFSSHNSGSAVDGSHLRRWRQSIHLRGVDHRLTRFQRCCNPNEPPEFTRFGAQLCWHSLLDHQFHWHFVRIHLADGCGIFHTRTSEWLILCARRFPKMIPFLSEYNTRVEHHFLNWRCRIHCPSSNFHGFRNRKSTKMEPS